MRISIVVVLLLPMLACFQVPGKGFFDKEGSVVLKRSLQAPLRRVNPHSDEGAAPHLWLRTPASPEELARTVHFASVYERLTPERKAQLAFWRPFRFLRYRMDNVKAQHPDAFADRHVSTTQLRNLEHRFRENAAFSNRFANRESGSPWQETFGPDRNLVREQENVVQLALEVMHHWPPVGPFDLGDQERHRNYQ